MELHQPGLPQPVQRFSLFVADAVVYIHDKRGEYLEFRSCLLIPNKFYQHRSGGPEIASVATLLGYRLQLFIKPHLRLQFAYPHQTT